MTRSSEVVMRLNGSDATDGMFDLVFSRPQGTILPRFCFSAACYLSSRSFSEHAVCIRMCVYACVCVCACVKVITSTYQFCLLTLHASLAVCMSFPPLST